MEDKCNEFLNRLRVDNYEYEGSVDFLEEELLRRELKDLKSHKVQPKSKEPKSRRESNSAVIQESIDELFLR